MEENISKIVLPKSEEVKKALESKLLEYRTRLKKWNLYSPEMLNSITSSGYKADICEKLLKKGEVSVEEFALELKKRNNSFNKDNYDNAVFVINDYLQTGGKNIYGGTGFPLENKIN